MTNVVSSYSSEEAIKKIQAVKAYMIAGNPIWSVAEMGEVFDIAIEALENNDKLAEDLQDCLERYKKKRAEVEALKQNQWIPCSEPPKQDDRYLITKDIFGGRYVDLASYAVNLNTVDEYDFPEKKSGWYNYDDESGFYEINNIIAWMPLPDPYKEETE